MGYGGATRLPQGMAGYQGVWCWHRIWQNTIVHGRPPRDTQDHQTEGRITRRYRRLLECQTTWMIGTPLGSMADYKEVRLESCRPPMWFNRESRSLDRGHTRMLDYHRTLVLLSNEFKMPLRITLLRCTRMCVCSRRCTLVCVCLCWCAFLRWISWHMVLVVVYLYRVIISCRANPGWANPSIDLTISDFRQCY